MSFSNDALKGLNAALKGRESPLCIPSNRFRDLIARLEGDESLLTRALVRLKLINGPESKCVYADSDASQCVNHQLIREIVAWFKAGGR